MTTTRDAHPLPALTHAPLPWWKSRLGVLRHDHFRWVWLGAFGSNLGTWMEASGTQWLVNEATGSTLALGYLAAAQMIAALVFGLVGGLVADKVNRRTLLLVTQAGLMVVAATLAVLAIADLATPRVLIILAAVQGTVMAFNIGGWVTLTPRLVPREDLPRAIALNSLQFNAARMIGPAIAGQIMALASPAAVFVLNTLSYCGVMTAIYKTPDAPIIEKETASSAALMREGFAFVFGNKGAILVLIAVNLFCVLAVPLQRQLPVFVTQVHHGDERLFGVLLGVLGAGAVLGGLAMQFVPKTYPRRKLIPLSLAGGGLGVAAFSLADALPLAFAGLIVTGFFWLWTFSCCWTAVQLLVPDRMRGRVMAINTTLTFGMMAVGNLIIGVVGEWVPGPFGVQLALGTSGALLTIIGLLMLPFAPREVDAVQA